MTTTLQIEICGIDQETAVKLREALTDIVEYLAFEADGTPIFRVFDEEHRAGEKGPSQ